jgi:hypothetical protein
MEYTNPGQLAWETSGGALPTKTRGYGSRAGNQSDRKMPGMSGGPANQIGGKGHVLRNHVPRQDEGTGI